MISKDDYLTVAYSVELQCWVIIALRPLGNVIVLSCYAEREDAEEAIKSAALRIARGLQP